MAIQLQKHAMLLILGFVGTVGATGTAGYFIYEKYKKLRDEEAAIKKQIEMAEIKISRIPALETDVVCLRENLTEAVKILPDTKEVNEFVNKLNDFADESDVRIRDLRDEKDRSKKKDVFDKVIYKIKMNANVEQFLAFLSLAEGWERFVRVTSVEVKAGDFDEEMAREDVRHEIAVNIETFSYRGHDDGAKSTTIHNYETLKESLREEIFARRNEIQVERYNLIANPLRRDMFIDPRRRVSEVQEGGLPYPEQLMLVDAMEERASDLRDLSEAARIQDTNFIRRLELETEIDQYLAALESDLFRVTEERLISDMSLRRRVDRNVRPIVMELQSRDSKISMAATKQDLERYQADMIRLLSDGHYDEVLSRFDTLASQLDDLELDAEGASLVQDIQLLAHQAEVAIDFNTKDLDIGGAIVAEQGSVVVVNGHVLQEGDTLDDDLVIHLIANDRIEFRYRGVVLARAR